MNNFWARPTRFFCRALPRKKAGSGYPLYLFSQTTIFLKNTCITQPSLIYQKLRKKDAASILNASPSNEHHPYVTKTSIPHALQLQHNRKSHIANRLPIIIGTQIFGFQALSGLKWFFLFISTFLLQSCRPNFTAETQAVDSLLGVIGQVENASKEVDPRLIGQYIKDIKEKCSKIQSQLTDTVELEQAQVLIDFCSLQKHLQSCLQRKQQIDAEVIATRNQLFNLRTDLTQQTANKDSVNQFIESEFEYVESLSEGTERVVAELNGCFETYSELKEDIDRLLISLPNSVEGDEMDY